MRFYPHLSSTLSPCLGHFSFLLGAGKSTFIENLGMKLIKKRNRVAVIPVDPSSHISGGSILGECLLFFLLTYNRIHYFHQPSISIKECMHIVTSV